MWLVDVFNHPTDSKQPSFESGWAEACSLQVAFLYALVTLCCGQTFAVGHQVATKCGRFS